MFISSFVSLFVIADPIGTAAVYSGLIDKDVPKEVKRKIAIKACVISIGLLVFFGLAGSVLLAQIGISLDAFRVAGGLLLFVTAFRMIMGFHDENTVRSTESCYKDLSNLAVFPLSVPLLAGPGCMTAVILNMNNAQNINEQLMIYSAIFVVEILALICMLCATKVVAVMGDTGSSILSRLMGILLAALSVQFIADGTIGIIAVL